MRSFRITQNLQQAYLQRQQCMGREDDALTKVKRLHAQVKTDVADFREVSRSRITTTGGRTALCPVLHLGSIKAKAL